MPLREEPSWIQTLGCTWGQLYNFYQCFCHILAWGYSTRGIWSLWNLAYAATTVCWRCCICFAEFPRSAPDDGGVWSWGCVCATCGWLPGHAVGVWSRHWQVELYFYPGLHIVSVNVVPTLQGGDSLNSLLKCCTCSLDPAKIHSILSVFRLHGGGSGICGWGKELNLKFLQEVWDTLKWNDTKDSFLFGW